MALASPQRHARSGRKRQKHTQLVYDLRRELMSNRSPCDFRDFFSINPPDKKVRLIVCENPFSVQFKVLVNVSLVSGSPEHCVSLKGFLLPWIQRSFVSTSQQRPFRKFFFSRDQLPFP